jgi:LuxR family maltose regulon positive regulatory protein
LVWLATHTSFLFQGRAGSLRAYKEARPRGEDYWYAYSFTDQRLHKRYLGRSSALSFARLEEVAGMLQGYSAPLAQAVQPQAAALLEDGATLPFLHSSLQVPRVPRTLVERPRLLRQLDAALTHPLTLVSASAGCGKTTLLSAWAARHARQVAWLSLERLDNDQTRFWVSLILALRTRLPDVGEAALAQLHSPQPTALAPLLSVLLNELASLPIEMVLILDDYHVIEEQALHEALFFFLEHLPANLHLILSTRVDPDFPLSRWRARGQLVEIRAADLRFTAPDASLFLREVMGLSLSEEQSGIVEQRTEGWIAGLQLTALSLQKQDDPSLFLQHVRGSHRYLLDYVQEEILQRQPVPMQRFLLQTAILTRMNAALCKAVTGEQAAQELLEEAERSNLFLVPLDEERQWYRFHELFREALFARLRASLPEQIPVLHRRAALWYEAQGFLHEAITYALEAEDAYYAADLIERVILPQSWYNEFPTLRRWCQCRCNHEPVKK